MVCKIKCFFLLVLSVLQLSFAIPDLRNREQISEPRLVFVGQADGKSFFLDVSVKLPWDKAESYCKSHNMNMAAITSKAQILAISSNIYNITNVNYIWSAGRNGAMYPSLDDFSWYDNPNGTEKPDTEVIRYLRFFAYLPSCLVFQSSFNGVDGLSFYSDWCGNPYFVLCQNS